MQASCDTTYMQDSSLCNWVDSFQLEAFVTRYGWSCQHKTYALADHNDAEITALAVVDHHQTGWSIHHNIIQRLNSTAGQVALQAHHTVGTSFEFAWLFSHLLWCNQDPDLYKSDGLIDSELLSDGVALQHSTVVTMHLKTNMIQLSNSTEHRDTSHWSISQLRACSGLCRFPSVSWQVLFL